jgi:hypothetical protein
MSPRPASLGVWLLASPRPRTASPRLLSGGHCGRRSASWAAASCPPYGYDQRTRSCGCQSYDRRVLAYHVLFARTVEQHLAALNARQRRAVLAAIEVQLTYQPTVRTRNRKPMDPDKRFYVAPWELRVRDLRVYYSVRETPEPVVVVMAVGVKMRERVRIGGKDVDA